MPEIRFVSALESGARALLIRHGEGGARRARSSPAAGGRRGETACNRFLGNLGKKRQHCETERSCVREELSDPCWLLVGRAVGKGAGAARAPDPQVLLHRSTSKTLVLLTALLHTFFETSSKGLF